MKSVIIERVADISMPQPPGKPPRPPPDPTAFDEPSAESEAARVVRHLAHELRQPLGAIESIGYYLELVTAPEDRKVRPQAAKLQQLVQQASGMLSDAVHFLQACPPSPEPVDLDEFISEAVKEAAPSEPVWLDIDLGAEPARVRVDGEQISHLLRTLLHLLVRLGKPDPHLSVRTSTDGRLARVEIETEGDCCSADDFTQMFQPFSLQAPEGCGLALASAQRIVDVHGGTLHYQREDDGRCRLRVELPAETCSESLSKDDASPGRPTGPDG